MPFLRLITAYVLIAAALLAFWFMAGKALPVTAPEPLPGRSLQSVSYAPFAADESPFEFAHGLVIPSARIDADLGLLARRFTGIRTYSVAGLEAVPEYAKKHGLKVMLGAWIGAEEKLNQQEIAGLIALARKHPQVVRAVVVGNEALLRREITGAQLAGYIRQVKEALPGILVTYADVWEFWLRNPEVAEACDFVTIHILPYWEDKPVAVTGAMAHVKWVREEVARRIPGKEIVIGETGWPSQGRMREGALPGLANQARFIRSFIALAEKEGWQYNLIEAFDQPWKRIKEGAVGGYWGLYSADRQDKGVLAGPVSRFPEWRMLFALSALVALCTLPLALRQRRMSGGRLLLFAAGASGGALLLVLQGRQFLLVSTSNFEYLWAVAVLALVAGVYLSAISALASGAVPAFLHLDAAMDFLRGKRRFSPEAGHGALRLGVAACALVAVLGLVLDARYRSFNNCAFVIPALVYAWFAWAKGGRPPSGSLLERLCALLLTAGALFILSNESTLNWQADIWVAICLLLAGPLWQKSRGVSLKALLPAALLSLGVFAAFWALREGIFISEKLVEVCAVSPDTLACQTRALIGKLMYKQVFAWTSIVLAVFAVWRNTAWLCHLALSASLAGLVFYNVDLAALAFVLAGLTLAHLKNGQEAQA